MIQDLYKQKRSLELKREQEHLDNNRYTLEMVRIDDKVKQVITEIKLEEAAIAHRHNRRCRSESFSSYLNKSYILKTSFTLQALLRSIQMCCIKDTLYN